MCRELMPELVCAQVEVSYRWSRKLWGKKLQKIAA